MENALVIHGHFYQPPREDPWMDHIFPEGSAAPFTDWNRRILRESYAPLARARRLDGKGAISDVVNCYEFMSFNFGPTLMRWVERADPATYRLILEADAKSIDRLGRGNAMAQVYHHPILPLASELDKKVEIAWGIADFKARFGRDPEGMWLAETAVDTPTLEALAEAGIAFTVLAPRQAKAVGDMSGGHWAEVNEGILDISQPYRLSLPSGRSIALFFYHGPLSQAVAFERLLEDGGRFWRRIQGQARPGLLALATDGETYGHHFKFGEMALAFALAQARDENNGLTPTNFAAFLATHPPKRQIRLHEPSSWSCVHGVERWRSDCGCTDGGHPGWNQKWRAPLREALNVVRKSVNDRYFSLGESLFRDPEAALIAFGEVMAKSAAPGDFAEKHLAPGLSGDKRASAFKLLAAQQWSLASFASCAWFFDDIARLEPVNAMTFANRALELATASGAEDLAGEVLEILATAVSNDPAQGTAKDIWNRTVAPRRESPARLAAQGLLSLWSDEALPSPGERSKVSWPGVSLEFTMEQREEEEPFRGRMDIFWLLEPEPEAHRWELRLVPGQNPLDAELRVFREGGEPGEWSKAARELPWNKRQDLACRWASRAGERSQGIEVSLAASGGWLFQPYAEGQSTQTLEESWQALFSGLALGFTRGLLADADGVEDLVRFLARTAASHPETPSVSRGVSHEVAQLAGKNPARAREMIERAKQIGLALDLWPAQNELWRLGQGHSSWRLLAEPLGFSPELG